MSHRTAQAWPWTARSRSWSVRRVLTRDSCRCVWSYPWRRAMRAPCDWSRLIAHCRDVRTGREDDGRMAVPVPVLCHREGHRCPLLPAAQCPPAAGRGAALATNEKTEIWAIQNDLEKHSSVRPLLPTMRVRPLLPTIRARPLLPTMRARPLLPTIARRWPSPTRWLSPRANSPRAAGNVMRLMKM